MLRNTKIQVAIGFTVKDLRMFVCCEFNKNEPKMIQNLAWAYT